MRSKGIAFSDFTKMIHDLQQTLKKENSLRVEMSENGEWDLVKSVTITPSKLIIDTEHSSMIFEEGDMTRAKIRRNLDDE